jgi:hypothetical protein
MRKLYALADAQRTTTMKRKTNPEEITVETLLQCWHIMPVVLDENEGEETWWILGPNNKANQEASTSGPFTTKEEAFNIALEHNRELGVDVVYVHGPGGGKFELPSMTPMPTEEQVMEVGDHALQNVLDGQEELQKEQKQSSKLQAVKKFIKNTLLFCVGTVIFVVSLAWAPISQIVIHRIIAAAAPATASETTDDKNDCFKTREDLSGTGGERSTKI